MSQSSSKKIKKTQIDHKENQKQITNRGKPSDIQKTELMIPDIWTNNQKCLILIKFLQDIGRHNCLHQAGKQTEKNKYVSKQQEIEKTRVFYEKAQTLAHELFGHFCETKRCIVFFFRSNKDEKPNYYDSSKCLQLHSDCHDILQKIHALLNQNFLDDLILILRSNQSTQQIIEQLYENSKSPQSFSQIIQNTYIKYVLDQMKKSKQGDNIYSFKNRAETEKDFYETIQTTQFKEEVEKFIKEIKLIFNRENQQYEQPDFQQSNMDFEENFEEKNLDEEQNINFEGSLMSFENSNDYYQ